MRIKGFLLLIGYIFFILALLEITTRVFFKVTRQDFEIYKNFSFSRKPHILVPDGVLGWKLKPSVSRNAFTSEYQVVYTTNSLGLREKEVTDTTKFKIMFLGDSFTFGEGVPLGSRFSDLIEKELSGVYSLNAGVPAYGVHQMFRYLNYHGIGLRPNLVICTIISHDLNRVFSNKIETSPHLQVEDPGSKKSLEVLSAPSLRQNLLKMEKMNICERSYFLTLAYVVTKILLATHRLEEREEKVWKDLRGRSRQNMEEMRRSGKQKWMRSENFRIFRGMKKLLTDCGTDLLVLNISKEPIPWLTDFLTAKSIDCLDLSRSMKAVPGLYFKIDPHMNASGNRWVAERLKEYLLERYKNRLFPA